MIERPLVSFAIYTYNEERYIGEAIQGALRQTYSPLEVVLSDDGSVDRTFEIMQRMAADYSGPHRVILNRGAKNEGIGAQLNAIFELSSGDLVLLGNGDDVSRPDRTERMVTEWLDSGRAVHAIWSDLAVIDEQGISRNTVMSTAPQFRGLEDGVRARFGGVAAASLAITRDVYDKFGPFHRNLIIEDNPALLRAILLGGYRHLTEPLVDYRTHPGNISRLSEGAERFEDWKRRVMWGHRESFRSYLQILNDLYSRTAESWPAEELERARWAAVEQLVERGILRDYWSGGTAVTLADGWRMVRRMVALLTKLTIKRLLPFIDRRNARWHYEQRRRSPLYQTSSDAGESQRSSSSEPL